MNTICTDNYIHTHVPTPGEGPLFFFPRQREPHKTAATLKKKSVSLQTCGHDSNWSGTRGKGGHSLLRVGYLAVCKCLLLKSAKAFFCFLLRSSNLAVFCRIAHCSILAHLPCSNVSKAFLDTLARQAHCRTRAASLFF